MSAVPARPIVRGADGKLRLLATVVAVAAIALLAEHKFGLAGLAAPVVLALLVAVFLRPRLAVGATVGLAILCEGPTFGVSLTTELYRNLYGGLEPLDVLVLISFFSVGYDLLRRHRQPRLPATPALAITLVILATLSGVVVGHGAGVGLKEAALSLHVLPFLVLMPLAVYNLDLNEAELVTVVRGILVLAEIKAAAGLVVMMLGLSVDVESGTHITYYEPTPNWITLLAILGLLAAGLAGALRLPPRGFGRRRVSVSAGWGVVRRAAQRVRGRLLLLALPLPVASLLLSYRRSFWIAAAVGILLVIALAATIRKRILIVLAVLLIGGGIWAVGAVPFQSQSPIVERVQSLSPNNLETNAEDRYRLDERANVVAEIKQNPIGGLGANVPWVAIARPLGVEHVGGRLYVHFALLWWWLKLGILGAVAYIVLLGSMALLALRAWRRNTAPELRYFGLASLCAVAGLVAIETTASFTGVDARFSVIIGSQLGLLAAMAQRRRGSRPDGVPPLSKIAPDPEPELLPLR